MADDKSKTGPADSSRINVNEDYELRYWIGALKCSEKQLKDAVKEVGTSSDAVREYLLNQS